jgi:hypothetical protein
VIYEHEVLHVYVPVDTHVDVRTGLAEAVLRRRLVKQGWRVWRSDCLLWGRKQEVYPNVQFAYEELAALLDKYVPDAREYLEYMHRVHHGLPDFICFRSGTFKFVECKLEHESLQLSQRKCIPKLQAFGFLVEVHKLVDYRTKARQALVDLRTGEKHIQETQLTISSAARRARNR